MSVCIYYTCTTVMMLFRAGVARDMIAVFKDVHKLCIHYSKVNITLHSVLAT